MEPGMRPSISKKGQSGFRLGAVPPRCLDSQGQG
jgi:hypothetical protein